MKLGLDLHGVIDKDPAFFKKMAKLVRDNGGEVHVITGEAITEKLYAQLGDEVFWDYIYSIQDELSKHPELIIGIDKHGRDVFPDTVWNSAKGVYCFEHKIDLHIDDTPAYGPYFFTPFMLYKG